MKKQKIQLSLHKNYVSDWDCNYAIREIVQNMIDNKSANIIYQEGGVLFLGNEEGVLDKKSLLLGNSTKQGNDYIGQFGEGYKLALLVLLRNGCDVRIFTNDEIWIPSFEKHDTLEEEVLTISIQQNNKENKGILFQIQGLDNVSESLNSVMLNRKQCNILHSSEKGEVLELNNFETQGKIYVNDMYVTDVSDFEFSYNFKPNNLELGRDRNIVNDWDVIYLTSDILSTFPDSKRLATLLKEDKKDIKYMESFKRNINKEVIEDLALEYENVIPVAYNDDVTNYEKQYDMSGLTCVSMPQTLRELLPKKKLKPKKKFTKEDFYKKHHKQFTKEMKREWAKLS